jgi:hypothetical protein
VPTIAGSSRIPGSGQAFHISTAAGDAVTGLNQIAVAMAEEEIAAVDVHNHLRQAEGRCLPEWS